MTNFITSPEEERQNNIDFFILNLKRIGELNGNIMDLHIDKSMGMIDEDFCEEESKKLEDEMNLVVVNINNFLEKYDDILQLIKMNGINTNCILEAQNIEKIENLLNQ